MPPYWGRPSHQRQAKNSSSFQKDKVVAVKWHTKHAVTAGLDHKLAALLTDLTTNPYK